MYGKSEENCMKNKTRIVTKITTRAVCESFSRQSENKYENENYIGDGGEHKIRNSGESVLSKRLTREANGVFEIVLGNKGMEWERKINVNS